MKRKFTIKLLDIETRLIMSMAGTEIMMIISEVIDKIGGMVMNTEMIMIMMAIMRHEERQ